MALEELLEEQTDTRMSSERDIQARVMLALGSRPNIRIFRNQVGFGYVGEPPNQRRVRFGLMPGSGDLIGWRTRVITASDIGKAFAQFLSVEVKSDTGKSRENQLVWATVVRAQGGIAIITRDPRKALEDIEHAALI